MMIGVAQFGEGRHDPEAVGDRAKLVAHTHADVPCPGRRRGALDDARRALRVETDVVEWRTGPAGRVVRSAKAMFEEGSQNALRPVAVGPGHVRSTDASARQRALETVGRVIVQLLVFLRRPVPVADVGLVPDFPVPALDFTASVFLDRVLDPSRDQIAPPVVVLRRIAPAGIDAVVVEPRGPVVLVGRRLRRHRFGHEADLDERLHLPFHVGVEDAIDNRPVVDRPAGAVLRIRVRRAPFHGRGAVARRQKVVRAHEYRNRTQRGQLIEEFRAVGRVGVVGLVVAEERPHLGHRPAPRTGVDPNRHAFCGLRRDERQREAGGGYHLARPRSRPARQRSQLARQRSYSGGHRPPTIARYSCRNATSGSMLAARRSGSHAASRAVSASTPAAIAKTVGSVGVSPKSYERARPVVIAAPADPRAIPQVTIRATSRSTSAITDPRPAPSAMHSPISFVRRATWKASSPNMPSAATSIASAPNAPPSAAIVRSPPIDSSMTAVYARARRRRRAGSASRSTRSRSGNSRCASPPATATR